MFVMNWNNIIKLNKSKGSSRMKVRDNDLIVLITTLNIFNHLGIFGFYQRVKYPLWKLSRNKILNKFLFIFAFFLKKVKMFFKVFHKMLLNSSLFFA